MVTHICDHSIWRQRQENCAFESTLGYITHCRKAKVILQDLPPNQNKIFLKAGMVLTSLVLALGRLRQWDCHMFHASLGNV